VAGDGTTTVLAQSIVNEGMKFRLPGPSLLGNGTEIFDAP